MHRRMCPAAKGQRPKNNKIKVLKRKNGRDPLAPALLARVKSPRTGPNYHEKIVMKNDANVIAESANHAVWRTVSFSK